MVGRHIVELVPQMIQVPPVITAADALAAGIEEALSTLLVHQRRDLTALLMAFYKARAGLA